MSGVTPYDVAIIGGGPAGSTLGGLLKKYKPELNVLIIEREEFPRDHVGESQLPPISGVLDELGCWDKVEAAGFPIKIGATYKWGSTRELWDFEFVPKEVFKIEPRPAKYEGHRRSTAFQVDRAIYDKILLDHAIELGAEVLQPVAVRKINKTGDRVDSLVLDDGREITARYYVDGSGHVGLLRRAMGVETEVPTILRNVAVWDYWQNAKWAVEIGVGGTRVQVISVPFGWIWFIPLGPTRTSVGLVTSAQYYKESGKSLPELYRQALTEDPLIIDLMTSAKSEDKLSTTTDWSFLAERISGENWFLAGESAGFADPILAAGLSITQVGARELASTIIELDRGRYSRDWLLSELTSRQTKRVMNHIRFAEYWYTANSQFSDLKEFTTTIADSNGLKMNADEAWRWIAQGGFITEDETTGSSGFSIDQIKAIGGFLHDLKAPDVLKESNYFVLNLDGAELTTRATYGAGEIGESKAYRRAEKVLPLNAEFGFCVHALQESPHLDDFVKKLVAEMERFRPQPELRTTLIRRTLQAFEALILDGWVTASYDPSKPLIDLSMTTIDIRRNTDQQAPVPAS